MVVCPTHQKVVEVFESSSSDEELFSSSKDEWEEVDPDEAMVNEEAPTCFEKPRLGLQWHLQQASVVLK